MNVRRLNVKSSLPTNIIKPHLLSPKLSNEQDSSSHSPQEQVNFDEPDPIELSLQFQVPKENQLAGRTAHFIKLPMSAD